MVEIYVELIKAGEKTLEDIKNKTIREKVRQKLIEDGWIEPEGEDLE